VNPTADTAEFFHGRRDWRSTFIEISNKFSEWLGRQMFRLNSLLIAFGLVVTGPACVITGIQTTESPETSHRAPPKESESSRIGLGFLHPLPSSEPVVCGQSRRLPQEPKDHVYVFLVNGLDPLYIANLNGLCAYLHELGFSRAEAVQMMSIFALRNRIQDIRTNDRQARLVLLGYSAGANCVRSLAQGFKKDPVTIDLMIYLGGITVLDADYSRPENVRRIVNITGGWIVKGEIHGARNEHVPVRHLALPSSARTIEILTEELVALTGCTPAAPAGAPKIISKSADVRSLSGPKPTRIEHEVAPH
jgi:hypothetical protein